MKQSTSISISLSGQTSTGIPLYTFAGMEFVKIPAGKFQMGSDDNHPMEKPLAQVVIPYTYFISRFPVTWAAYQPYGNLVTPDGVFTIPEGKEQHPVVNVAWSDALAFANWLNDGHASSPLLDGFAFCLPSEAEWEKAARGNDKRIYPWGNKFDGSEFNCRRGTVDVRKPLTTPVGKYSPKGDSPYGAADMAGNVWEWTRSLYKSYPYNANDGREDLRVEETRVVRGGSWYDPADKARTSDRSMYGSIRANLDFNIIGFRLVYLPKEVVSA